MRTICAIGRFASAVCGLSLLLTTGLAHAQVLSGSVVVEVRDESGGAIVGAEVTIVQTETNWTRSSTTAENGTASFATVPLGTFQVKVVLSGFNESLTNDVRVTQDSVSRVRSTLVIGAITDSVSVSAGTAVLQTDRADVRTELAATQLQNLPVPVGRNYQNLFVTIPGVSPPENMHSVAVNPARGLGFNSNGTTRNSNAIRIEGSITNNLWLPHVAAYVPALEAIETVSVVTSTFDADQGLSGGMSANVVIKSGTNQFRGSLFEYFYNEKMKSRPYFLPATEEQPKARQNQFGGTLGGPIVRNRLFFFGSYEGTYDNQVGQRFGTVPTAAMRNGDLSASGTPIYDPSTGNADGSGRTAFSGNQIPRDRLDPITQKLLADLPLPTFNDRLSDNYFVTGLFEFARRKTDAKVTFNATEKLMMSARLGWLNYDFKSPPMFGDLGGPPVHMPAAKMGDGLGDTYTITGSATYALRQNFLIETYTGITLIQVLSEPPRMDENLGLDFLGIPGTNGPSRLYGGWPQFDVTGFSQIGYSGSMGSPYIDDNWQYQYSANASWTKGAHIFRFGGDIVRQALNRFETGNGSGTFTFAGGPTTTLGGASPNLYNNFGSFLLGLPTQIAKSEIPFEDNQTRSRNWQFSLFAKDQWHIGRALTASLGVRWDYFPAGTRTTRGLERFDYENNQMLICGVADVPKDCGYDMGFGNFSPRLGLAYRASDAMVIRGGYGINYDPYPLAFTRDLLGNYPSSIGLTLTQPNAFQPAGRLANGIPPIQVPDISSGRIPVPANIGARTLDDKPKRGYIHSWNVTMQRELPWALTGQVAYVGTRQRDINQILNINAGQVIGAGDAGRPFFAQFRRTAETGLLTNVGWSDYDALQTSLQRRFVNGFQLTVGYTLAKAFGICCDNLADNPPEVQAMEYFYLNEAPLNHDRRHNFQTSFILELPFGNGKRFLNNGGVMAAIAGGWQVNGLFSAYSGAPMTIRAAGTSLNLPNSTQVADQIKPDVDIPGDIGPTVSYFDPTAFAPVTQARFGNAGLNSLRGPGFANVDFSVQRQFSLGQRMNLQFRAEVFNLTNTAHFGNPGATSNSLNVSNLQLNADGSVRNLGGFSTITTTANSGRDGIDERLFRVGVRFGF